MFQTAARTKTFQTVIEEREQAKKMLVPKSGELHIFIDGLDIDNMVGAIAMTTMQAGVQATLRYQPGNDNQYTVYEAE